MRERGLSKVRCSEARVIPAQASPVTLKAVSDAQPVRTGNSLLGLQKKYGNRYVQRLLSSANQPAKPELTPAVQSLIEQAREGGQALGRAERSTMEQAFGADFSGVRIHTDSQANVLSRALGAVAFAIGQDIFFRQGAHDPTSAAGRELLAHELTHVAQQGKDAVQSELSVGQPGDAYEREADQMARRVGNDGTVARGDGLQKIEARNSIIRRQNDAGAPAGPQPDLAILNPGVIPNLVIIHPTDTIDIQWTTGNFGAGPSQAFKDRLQVFKVSDDTNHCPGSDADLGNPVYDTDSDTNVNLQEGPIAAGQRGPLMVATVGPFPSGSYRFTVMVNSDFGEPNESNTANNSSFNCKDIEDSGSTDGQSGT